MYKPDGIQNKLINNFSQLSASQTLTYKTLVSKNIVLTYSRFLLHFNFCYLKLLICQSKFSVKILLLDISSLG